MAKAEWITAKEAAEIISKNSGRPIIQQYVRDLSQKGRIKHKPLDGRTNVYLRSDVEKVRIKKNRNIKDTSQEESLV